MQKLIEYAKQPSNFDDYVSLFNTLAKMKPTIQCQAQKKEYFKQNITSIISSFVSYLIKEGNVTAKNQTEFINKFQKNEIQHADLTIYFTEWLDTDKVFIYQKKQIPAPRPPPNQPRAYQPMNQTLQHQQASTATKSYPRPSTSIQSRSYQPENKREQTNSSSLPPFEVSKTDYRPQIPNPITKQKLDSHNQVPLSQIHKYVPPALLHTNQAKKTYGNQNTALNQVPRMQHYTPHLPDESKPFRQRFFEKLVDYFEYPERVANIKQDMSLMFQQRK